MRHFTHLAGGVLAGVICLKLGWGLTGFFAALVGAVLPDSDIATGSGIRRFMKRALIKHRGLTHSLVFALLSTLTASAISKNAGIGIFLGIASHLALDSMNPMGIELFWPLKKRVRGNVRYRLDNDIKATIALSVGTVLIWIYF